MKKEKIFYCIISTSFVAIIILVLLNNYISYSMRIGDTSFYLVETMATSEEGKPLLGLYFEVRNNGGYKGVEMSGFPRIILWNEKYLISKNYDGKDTTITNYVIINQKSVNSSDGSIADIHIYKILMTFCKKPKLFIKEKKTIIIICKILGCLNLI